MFVDILRNHQTLSNPSCKQTFEYIALHIEMERRYLLAKKKTKHESIISPLSICICLCLIFVKVHFNITNILLRTYSIVSDHQELSEGDLSVCVCQILKLTICVYRTNNHIRSIHMSRCQVYFRILKSYNMCKKRENINLTTSNTHTKCVCVSSGCV